MAGRKRDCDWLEVHADQEYWITVHLRKNNRQKVCCSQQVKSFFVNAINVSPQQKDSYAFAPRFGKPKDEGWILVVGDIEQKEVVALKRVG